MFEEILSKWLVGHLSLIGWEWSRDLDTGRWLIGWSSRLRTLADWSAAWSQGSLVKKLCIEKIGVLSKNNIKVLIFFNSYFFCSKRLYIFPILNKVFFLPGSVADDRPHSQHRQPWNIGTWPMAKWVRISNFSIFQVFSQRNILVWCKDEYLPRVTLVARRHERGKRIVLDEREETCSFEGASSEITIEISK